MTTLLSVAEVPYLVSTSVDRMLASKKNSARSQQRLRDEAMVKLKFGGSRRVSIGTSGSTHLMPTSAIALAAVTAITPGSEEWLVDRLRAYGLAASEPGSVERKLFTSIESSFRTTPPELLERISKAGRINRALREVTVQSQELRDFAIAEGARWQKFSAEDSKFERVPARLVRVEGDDALITFWNEEKKREELRTMDANQLADNGIVDEGDAFVLFEFTHAPLVKISFPVPAFSPAELARDYDAEDRVLDSYDKPLPQFSDVESADGTFTDNDQTRVG